MNANSQAGISYEKELKEMFKEAFQPPWMPDKEYYANVPNVDPAVARYQAYIDELLLMGLPIGAILPVVRDQIIKKYGIND